MDGLHSEAVASRPLPADGADPHASPICLGTLSDRLAAAAASRPDETALRVAGGEHSYRWLHACSTTAAGHLAALGVVRGDRVLIAAAADARLVAMIFACLRAGAAFVLQDPELPERGLDHVCRDAAPSLVVTDAPTVAAVARRHGIGVAGPSDLLNGEGDGTAAPLPGQPLPNDLACLVYTSGSTAMPKAVACTHAQMAFAVQAIQTRLGYGPGDVVFCTLPLTFDYGLYQLFLAVNAAACLYLTDQTSAGQSLVRHLQDSAATILPAVPSLATNLVRLLQRRPADLPRLRLLTNTGAAMPPAVLRELRAHLPGLRVQLMYGLTECKRATIMPPDGDLARPGSCGLPLPGTEVYAGDAQRRPLPPGEIGELVVRGPNVMAGYWNHPELTDRRFPRENGLIPVLLTGDRGWVDEAGYVYFAGRDDDQYKQNGIRVSTIEVAAMAGEIPGVLEADVVPPRDGNGAILVARANIPAASLMAALAQRLERGKMPASCVIVAELPYTAHGKVARDRLAELAPPRGVA